MHNLELRMYGLVPYNISPIQQAIQFGHAVVEYGLSNFTNEDYQEWAKDWKTFIILNGGTSNHTQNRYNHNNRMYPEQKGTMEINLSQLHDNNIKVATFYEPDLNDMLSAIVFIVDERVFNKEKYPDFDLKNFYGKEKLDYNEIYKDPMNPIFPNNHNLIGERDVKPIWNNWVESIGGRQNLFLRVFLKNFKLA